MNVVCLGSKDDVHGVVEFLWVMVSLIAHARTARRKVVRSVELQGRAEGKVALRDGVA